MSIRMLLALGFISIGLFQEACGDDRVSIRIYSTDSPVTREANERIESAMREVTIAPFENRPLREVLNDIAANHEINLWIDAVTLQAEGINLDQSVNLSPSNIGLETALRLILDQVGLTTFIEDGMLKVTSVAKAGEIMHTRFYPVADLVEMGYPSLVKFIERSTDGKWMGRDGSGGVIHPHRQPRLLEIMQTDRGHRQIAGALTAFRDAKKLQQANFTKPDRANGPSAPLDTSAAARSHQASP